MQPEEAIAALHAFDEKRYAIEHAMSLLYVDGYTAAPKESWRGRSRTTGYLSSLAYEAASDPRLREAVLTVLEQKEIDARTRRLAVLLRDDMEDMLLFPREEYIENQKLLSEAGSVWHEAKEKSDYALFAPYLDKIIAYKKRYASLKDSSSDAYDVILDSYQKGLCTKTLDAFFTSLSVSRRGRISCTVNTLFTCSGCSALVSWTCWALTPAAARWEKPSIRSRKASTNGMSASPPGIV